MDSTSSFLPALAIELSQHEGSVVARNTDGREEVRTFAAGRRDRDALLPAIDETIEALGIGPNDLELIGVDIGPGGFTGLRISIATAQAIAEVTGAALVGVGGAVVAAAGTPETQDASGEILVFLASKRETAWCARLTRDGDGWRETVPPEIVSESPSSTAQLALADEHLPEKIREALLESGATIIKPIHEAHAVLQQAIVMLQRGESIPPESLQPRYPREPEAVRNWRNIR